MSKKIQPFYLSSQLWRRKIIQAGCVLLVLFLFLLPSLWEGVGMGSSAFACPLCQGGATKNTAVAYKGITLLLGLMPIVGGIGIFYWLYCKSKYAKDSD